MSDTSSEFLNLKKTVLTDTKDLLPDPEKRRTVNFILGEKKKQSTTFDFLTFKFVHVMVI